MTGAAAPLDHPPSFPTRSLTAFKLLLWFHIAYLTVVVLGSFLFKFNPIGLITYLVGVTYLSYLLVGAFLAEQLPTRSIVSAPAKPLAIDRILYCLAAAVLFTTSYTVYAEIKIYGSIAEIMLNAGEIRSEMTGTDNSFTSPIVTYITGLGYAAYALCLARYGATKASRYPWLAAFFFLCIIVNDMTTFGRSGLIYTCFCTLGFFVVYRVKLFTPKTIGLLLAAYVFYAAPRLIRGGFDNFESSMSGLEQATAVNVPPALNGILVAYTYYFITPYALDRHLNSTAIERRTYGARQFAPVMNIVNRLTDTPRIVTTLEESMTIPFETNVYTIVYDIFVDFGTLGLVALPLIFGFLLGVVFRATGEIEQALKIYLTGWIFYTPLCNAFNFGGFFLSCVLLIALVFWSRHRRASVGTEYASAS